MNSLVRSSGAVSSTVKGSGKSFDSMVRRGFRPAGGSDVAIQAGPPSFVQATPLPNIAVLRRIAYWPMRRLASITTPLSASAPST